MLKRLIYSGLVASIVLGLFSACAMAAREDQAPVAMKTPAPSPAARQGWENEWEEMTQAARQEGKLVIFTDVGGDAREELTQVLETKFGVGLEFVAGRPAEFATRLILESRSGINTGDLYLSGGTTALVTLKPEGLLEPLDPLVILPEARDTKVWWGGHMPFTDKDHMHIGFLATVTPFVTINTDLIKPDAIKSYRDLLRPELKGKIVLNDPTIGGAGIGAFVALAEGVMDVEFLRELGNQEPEINRDNRLQVEWVARGKYPIGLFLKPSEVVAFRKLGAPIKDVVPHEGAYVTASTGGISLLKNAPHPNAGKLFLNWALTKEGQTTFSRLLDGQSAREDVPFDHLAPENRRQPGVKYWIDSTEESTFLKQKDMGVAKEMYGHLLK